MISYSIIQKSQLEGALRLDAEYYQPEYLNLFSKIKRFKDKKFGEIADILRGNTPKEYGDFEVPVIRSGDLSNFFISEDLLKAKNQNIFYVNKNDILISSIGLGSIGKVNIFNGENEKFGTVSEVTVIRNSQINPFYIWAFLRSKFGQFQIDREITGATGQLHLNTGNVKNIIVPLIDNYNDFELIYKNAEKFNEQSENFYTQAENLLLQSLGLSAETLAKEERNKLWNIVKLSETQKANRIDAEYFQSIYKNLESRIKNYGTKELENFIKDYSTGFPFKSENYQEEGIPLIRINNIKKGYLDLNDTAFLSEKDHLLSLKDIAKPGDVVLSMSGTIGMSAVIPDDMPKSSVNQRILKFTPQNIDRNYLALLLNSFVGLHQLGRIGTGGVQTNISYKDIKNILVPILPKSTQQKIADLVQKSHEARKKAKQLLEQAKQKVENLIEEK